LSKNVEMSLFWGVSGSFRYTVLNTLQYTVHYNQRSWQLLYDVTELLLNVVTITMYSTLIGVFPCFKPKLLKLVVIRQLTYATFGDLENKKIIFII
jgi:hypothetical protein